MWKKILLAAGLLLLLLAGTLGWGFHSLATCDNADHPPQGDYDYNLANDIFFSDADQVAPRIAKVEIYRVTKSPSKWTSLQDLHNEALLRTLDDRQQIGAFWAAFSKHDGGGLGNIRGAARMSVVVTFRDGRRAFYAMLALPDKVVTIMPDSYPCEFGSHGADSRTFYDYLADENLLPEGWPERVPSPAGKI